MSNPDGLLTAEEAMARNDYWRGQVVPRSALLVFSSETLIPLLLGVGIGGVVPSFVHLDVPIQEAASIGLNYAAFSFGACVTGAVLAIGLPSEDRIRRWASIQTRDRRSVYGDLVFALSWAATSQLAVLIVCAVAVVVGGQVPLMPEGIWLSHRLLLTMSLTVVFYGVGQLWTLVTTISQLGSIIEFESSSGFARRRAGEPDEG